MVILALLKSNGRTPLQWWTFRDAKIISIGRSLSNQVIVRNSHVSRRHCELRLVQRVSGQEAVWTVVGQGKNGTFLNGKPVTQEALVDGATIQLAPKGPVLKVYLRDRAPDRDELLFGSLDDELLRAKVEPARIPAPQQNASKRVLPLSTTPPAPSVAPGADAARPAQPMALNSAAPNSAIPLERETDVSSPMSAAQKQRNPSPNQGTVAPGKVRGTSPGMPRRSSPLTDVEDRPRISTVRAKAGDARKGVSLSSSLASHSDMDTDGFACDHAGNQASNLLCVRCGQPLRVIRTVRRYQLLRMLGQGGMGTTFLAWRMPLSPQDMQQPPGQRLVVVKQLNPEVSAIAKARELFEREAQVLQSVKHKGIPRFLDFFPEDDKAYLVMELIHGKNLEQYVLKQGPVEPNQAIRWMQQTCDVLHHLHTQHPPILHRDIKPANLLRQYRDGRIIVVDFGAVKSLAGVMGTCIKAEGYTAPEQEAGNPTIASDLFSVGATLIFLLTRQSPLDFLVAADQMSLDGAAQIPPALRFVLEKALATEVSDRYSSALEMKLALGACLDLDVADER